MGEGSGVDTSEKVIINITFGQDKLHFETQRAGDDAMLIDAEPVPVG